MDFVHTRTGKKKKKGNKQFGIKSRTRQNDTRDLIITTYIVIKTSILVPKGNKNKEKVLSFSLWASGSGGEPGGEISNGASQCGFLGNVPDGLDWT